MIRLEWIGITFEWLSDGRISLHLHHSHYFEFYLVLIYKIADIVCDKEKLGWQFNYKNAFLDAGLTIRVKMIRVEASYCSNRSTVLTYGPKPYQHSSLMKTIKHGDGHFDITKNGIKWWKCSNQQGY